MSLNRERLKGDGGRCSAVSRLRSATGRQHQQSALHLLSSIVHGPPLPRQHRPRRPAPQQAPDRQAKDKAANVGEPGDAARLWINGQLIINNTSCCNEPSGTIALTAGQFADIQLEFTEVNSGAYVKLSWSSPTQPKEILPQAQLFPPEAAPTPTAAPETGWSPAYYDYGSAKPHAVTGIDRGAVVDDFGYDGAGNMTTRLEAGVPWSQTFSSEGRLSQISNGTDTWTFFYDGDGNRIKQENPDGTLTLFLAAGSYEVSVAISGASIEARRYYSIAGQRIALRGSDAVSFLLTDHLGSVSILAADEGGAANQQRYFPYGSPRLNGFGESTQFAFTGQRSHELIGLMDYQARWYSPQIGTFISSDTVGTSFLNPQLRNRMAYASGNPLRFSDPTGHYICEGPGHYCRPGRPIPFPEVPSASGGASAGSPNLTSPAISGAPTPPHPAPTETPSPHNNGVGTTFSQATVTPTPASMAQVLCPTLAPGQVCTNPRWHTPVHLRIDASRIDWVDAGVDVLGIAGDIGLRTGHPVGLGLWGVSEVAELGTIGKAWDDLDLGDPTGVLLMPPSVLAKTGRIAPFFGYLANLVGLVSNLGNSMYAELGQPYLIGSPEWQGQ